MRKQLNTLYITTEGAYLRKEGEAIVLEVDGEQRARVPMHMLESLVCIGRVGISPRLMAHCMSAGISICHLTAQGRFLARVEGPVSGNVLLRRIQYRTTDNPDACAHVVRHLLVGKIHNQHAVLARGWRDYHSELPAPDRYQHALKRLHRIPHRVLIETRVDVLRGLEGEAAQSYFGVFGQLVRVHEPRMAFTTRSRRPPLDAFNALLSFLYTC